MSQLSRELAARYTLGPAPAPASETRELVLIEIVKARKLGRATPSALRIGDSIDRARATVRWHLAKLKRDGVLIESPRGLIPTDEVFRSYYPKG